MEETVHNQEEDVAVHFLKVCLQVVGLDPDAKHVSIEQRAKHNIQNYTRIYVHIQVSL